MARSPETRRCCQCPPNRVLNVNGCSKKNGSKLVADNLSSSWLSMMSMHPQHAQAACAFFTHCNCRQFLPGKQQKPMPMLRCKLETSSLVSIAVAVACADHGVLGRMCDAAAGTAGTGIGSGAGVCAAERDVEHQHDAASNDQAAPGAILVYQMPSVDPDHKSAKLASNSTVTIKAAHAYGAPVMNFNSLCSADRATKLHPEGKPSPARNFCACQLSTDSEPRRDQRGPVLADFC